MRFFNNMKIGARLTLVFGLVMSLLIVIAGVGVNFMASLNRDIGLMTNDRFPKTVWANDIIHEVNVIARSMRNSLLVADTAQREKELSRIPEARKVIVERIERLEVTIQSDEGKRRLAHLKEARSRFVEGQNAFLSAVKNGQVDEASRLLLGDLEREQAAYFDAVSALIAYQSKLMDEAGKQALAEFESVRAIMFGLALMALILSGVGAFLVIRSITRSVNQAVHIANRLSEGDLTTKIEVASNDELGLLLSAMQNTLSRLSQIIAEVRSAANQLSTASEQVSATSQSLSQASTEQSASVEETSASIEQMAASIKQNAENANVTESMACKAATEANEGGSSVRDTVAAMKSIASKISIVDDIAYQTNLLALNAAIEAARAGEHGKGFAVVAAEVRKLAERSQVAAQEIGELADSSVDMAEKAGRLLESIVPSIARTSDLVQEIAAASQEQNSGASQINSAMCQLSQVTQQNAAASEQLAATAEEMSSQADQLQQLMSYFRISQAETNGATQHSTLPVWQSAAKTPQPASSTAGDSHLSGFVRF